MHIYIPSKGRSNDVVCGKYLPEELAPFVRIVVHNDEEAEYIDTIRDGKKFIMATPAVGIAAVRQWILENSLSKYSFFIDDDTVFDWRDRLGKLHKCKGKRFIKMYNLLESWLEEGLTHVGVSQRVGNNRITDDYAEVTRMNNVYAYNGDVALEAGGRFDRLEVMEDFDMTLTLLKAGHKNRVAYNYCWSQKKSGAAGGCSTYRNFEMQDNAAKTLSKLHPGMVRVCTKTAKVEWEGIGNKRTDVVISWKKAFKPRERDKTAGIGAFLK